MRGLGRVMGLFGALLVVLTAWLERTVPRGESVCPMPAVIERADDTLVTLWPDDTVTPFLSNSSEYRILGWYEPEQRLLLQRYTELHRIYRVGAEGRRPQVWLETDEAELTLITTTPTLYYMTFNRPLGTYTLYRAEADGSHPQRIAGSETLRNQYWVANDGSGVLFKGGWEVRRANPLDYNDDLYYLDTAAGTVRLAYAAPDDDYVATWGPDARSMLTVLLGAGSIEWTWVNLQSGATQAADFPDGAWNYVANSDDYRNVLFVNNGTQRLAWLDWERLTLLPLDINAHPQDKPIAAPDGRLFMVDLRRDNPHNWLVAVSPDGQVQRHAVGDVANFLSWDVAAGGVLFVEGVHLRRWHPDTDTVETLYTLEQPPAYVKASTCGDVVITRQLQAPTLVWAVERGDLSQPPVQYHFAYGANSLWLSLAPIRWRGWWLLGGGVALMLVGAWRGAWRPSAS